MLSKVIGVFDRFFTVFVARFLVFFARFFDCFQVLAGILVCFRRFSISINVFAAEVFGVFRRFPLYFKRFSRVFGVFRWFFTVFYRFSRVIGRF